METVMSEWADDSLPKTVTGMVELLAPGGNSAMPVVAEIRQKTHESGTWVHWFLPRVAGCRLVRQSDTLAALAAQQAEIDQLKARLEHDQAHGWDGIACRDETIKMLDGRVSRLTAERDKALALSARNQEALDANGKLIDSMNSYLKVLGAGSAARAVMDERQRQISVEGWTPEHDDAHYDEALAFAAACLVTAYPGDAPPAVWPWDRSFWKPKDRRSNLVRAGALILAEIERLDRAEKAKEGGAS
jgi:hypothetical protein